MHTDCEKVTHKGHLLAVIVRAESSAFSERISFVTPEDFPFQVGIHNREENEDISPHFHLPFKELKDFPVQEFFYVLDGSVKIDLYDPVENKDKVEEVIIHRGDMIVLNTGHGFTFLEKSRLLELKQGPYRGRENEKKEIKR